MTQRWLYKFNDLEEVPQAKEDDWDGVRGLLGGKGANLADMAALGIPVPHGFTITTEACNAYSELGQFPDGLWDEVLAAMAAIEKSTGKTFGGSENPLLVSVRSGAKFSMPGMMDTVLNVGLNDDVAAAMIELTGDAHFVFDSYRRLIQMFGTVVRGIDSEPFEGALRRARAAAGVANDSELSADVIKELVTDFKGMVAVHSRKEFPTDPMEQLRHSVEAVFKSWNSKRAQDYRAASKIPDTLGTAVNVMAMVFGNSGEDSGTGVAMSRDGKTGEPALEGDYLMNAQGEDVVAGNRPTRPIEELAGEMPGPAEEFAAISKRLETHYRDMQDMEFTIEDGRLWLLQTRTGKRTAQAAVRIAVDMVNEGLISKEEAVRRVTPEQVDFFLHPQFSAEARSQSQPIAHGLNVSPGAAVGVVAFDPDLAERWGKAGRDVVLVRPETKPDDVHGMLAAAGILTSSGGRTSHAALVARQFGKPAVTGATEIEIDLTARNLTAGSIVIEEGDFISIDGTTGEVFAGQVPTVSPDLDNEWLTTLLGWADEFRTLGVRANVDDPEDAARARRYGASGVGLCRTEHMFFEPSRLPIFRHVITAETLGEQRDAIDALLPLQRDDFAGLFRAMDGLPVIIRLLDPPLHEFLPGWEALHRTATDLQLQLAKAENLDALETILADLNETRSMLARVTALHEANPMLGLRGVRLGIKMPDITRMQARAVFEAAVQVIEEGGDPRPEIMVPLVSHVNELQRQRQLIEEVAEAVMEESGQRVEYLIGTMIEVPRAALTADAIAEFADFISFGTNDLTQTTYAISRDDAEEAFLLDYLANGILTANPFATIDIDGVGRLMQIALEGARHRSPDIESGVCGEHGGDPASIALCHELGLDYVSCSAFRIPVARLAAAQAALRAKDAAGKAG
ncbi:MAG: pyruvate, phosphate dikinase [Acidimicrobiales bacterium]|nr:pyruvate, phosphate dikinase [Acidimicrobiales bacterium]RZV48593.1 MAG: pyruvate, phosphate dikinase [Acidimicrobiales bacterium]